MLRNITLLVIAISMFGYANIEGLLLSREEKINEAFPVNPTVSVSVLNIRTMLATDEVASKQFSDDLENKLKLRASTCSAGIDVKFYETIKSIAQKPLDTKCLGEQDVVIADYLGIKQVAMRFALPPLREKTPLGIPSRGISESAVDIVSTVAASDAGIAVLQGARGEAISIEIPSGAKIAELPSAGGLTRQKSLSPNGRIYVVQLNPNTMLFIDTETGSKLWETTQIRSILAWIPEVSSILVSDSSGKGLSLLDLEAGKLIPYPIDRIGDSWAVSVSDEPSRVLIGSSQAFSLIENVREEGFVKSTTLKHYRLSKGNDVSSGTPVIMQNGAALVFVSMRDLVIVNLDSGKETRLPIRDIFQNRFAKLDEDSMLLDSYGAASSMSQSHPWAFNIKEGTLSAVQGEAGTQGLLIDLGARSGFLRRGHKQVWFGDKVNVGGSISTETLFGSHNGQNPFGVRTTLEKLARSGQPPTLTALEKYSPNCKIDNLKLPSDTVVLSAGTFFGRKLDYVIDDSDNAAYQVDVTVNYPEKPIALMLGAYDPTIWNIARTKDTKIIAVLASGYRQQRVAGLDTDVPVLAITSSIKSSCHTDSRFERSKINAEDEALSQHLFGRSIYSFTEAVKGEVLIGHPIAANQKIVRSNQATPESFRLKGEPLYGAAGLEEALRKKLIRKATQKDADNWTEELRKKYATMKMDPPDLPPSLNNAYVILKPFIYPKGLRRDNRATFYLPKGVPLPIGNYGESLVYNFNSMEMECKYPGCKKRLLDLPHTTIRFNEHDAIIIHQTDEPTSGMQGMRVSPGFNSIEFGSGIANNASPPKQIPKEPRKMVLPDTRLQIITPQVESP